MRLSTYFFLLLSWITFSQTGELSPKVVDSILKTIDDIPSHYEKVMLLSGFAGKYNYQHNTLGFIKKIKSIGNDSDKENIKAVSYYTLANYYLYNSKPDSAYIEIKKANDLVSKEKDPVLKSSILTTLGGYYKSKGSLTKAITMFLEAKNILDNINTEAYSKEEGFKLKGKILVLNNSLANIYNQLEEYDSAIKYYDLAFQSTEELGSLVFGAIILSNKGDLLLKTGNYQEALQTLARAKELKIRGNASQRSIGVTELTLGITYRKSGMLNKAQTSFNKSLAIFKKINNLSGISNTLFERGKLYNQLGNYTLAKKDCEKAKQLAYELGNLDFQKNACHCLFQTYKELGEYKKALENYELFLQAKDSLFNEKNIKKITQLQMQYEFDKQQTAQKLKTQKTEQQRKLYLILALSGFLITSLLGFFYLKNRKKNKQISKALQDKEILLKEIHHRVKNNLQVVSSLLSLQQRQTKDSNANIALQEGRNRVKAMALIHQNLYQDHNLVGVNVNEYVTKLVNSLVNTYKLNNKDVLVTIQVEPIKLDVDTIIPLGLIINELISNVLKHAFVNKEKGVITISLRVIDNLLTLTVEDNGSGLPEDFSVENTQSLGYKLVYSFSQKLEADLSMKGNKEGTKIVIKIKKFKTV